MTWNHLYEGGNVMLNEKVSMKDNNKVVDLVYNEINHSILYDMVLERNVGNIQLTFLSLKDVITCKNNY